MLNVDVYILVLPVAVERSNSNQKVSCRSRALLSSGRFHWVAWQERCAISLLCSPLSRQMTGNDPCYVDSYFPIIHHGCNSTTDIPTRLSLQSTP
jgi:hypothetical protein